MQARLVTCGWLMLALSAGLFAQQFDAARSYIKGQLVESGVPSIAVAVARKGQIVWEEGFGWADRDNRKPATPHTVYSMASISKPMTATALMILVQRGKVNLDAPVDQYIAPAKLTGYAGPAAGATVRRVANHSAGLPLHTNFFYSHEPYRPPPMDETIRRYGILVSPPGEEYRYSNIGFGILGHLIARVSGRSYRDFLREEVFLPLGLAHTSVDVAPGLRKYEAIRYGRDGLPIPFYDFDHPAASAVFASAHDLVRFGMFHSKAHLPDQKAILSDAAIDQMQQPTVSTGDRSGYGIGWMTGDRGGYRTVSHGGAMGGVRNLILLVPAEQIAVVVLCNLGNNEIPAHVADAILGEMLPPWKPAPAAPPEPAPGLFRPDSGLAGRWKGELVTHAGRHPFLLQINPSGDVHAQLGDQLQTLLTLVHFENSRLTGHMTGDVGTEDARRRPHHINLSLKLRGGVLEGSATATSTASNLTSWLRLKRDAAE
ncbi:MAG TPA: serine hydrolase domain-containing protein [Bryobacteraceae bacterium]|nr:serine hydrolase domain-containing protein [Bryobacteraceae bacterium]